MKRLLITGILFLSIVFASGFTQSRSNYVVIGVFRNKDNAVHFTDAARTNHMSANYAVNKVRQLYFVFVMHTEDVHKAVDEVLKLRANSEYTGAWVYQGVLGDDQVHDGVEINASAPVAPPSDPPVMAEIKPDKQADPSDKDAEVVTPVTEPAAGIQFPEAGKADDATALTKVFFFKVYTLGAQPKAAKVEMIDVDREKKVNYFKANEPVVLKSINTSGDLRFDCIVAGYRRVTRAVNFKNPTTAEAGIVLEDNKVIVPFELTRLKKGDKEILYNIYFYKDAAIMRPESKYELDELLAMMNENSKYRIKLHGHTNGKASGKIIEMGESKNFFSLTGSKDGFGSAKKLSEERAQLIREYLTSEGVAPERMEIKAWGGKKPIYELDHAQASSNVRVEVEILAD